MRLVLLWCLQDLPTPLPSMVRGRARRAAGPSVWETSAEDVPSGSHRLPCRRRKIWGCWSFMEFHRVKFDLEYLQVSQSGLTSFGLAQKGTIGRSVHFSFPQRALGYPACEPVGAGKPGLPLPARWQAQRPKHLRQPSHSNHLPSKCLCGRRWKLQWNRPLGCKWFVNLAFHWSTKAILSLCTLKGFLVEELFFEALSC